MAREGTLPPWTDRIGHVLNQLRHDPVPRPVAGGVVVDRSGRLVLVYSEFPSPRWHFPQGGVDEGETVREGAIKEIGEEAGIEVGPQDALVIDMGLRGEFHDSLGFGSPRCQPPGTIFHPSCNHFDTRVTITSAAHASPAISLGAHELLLCAARLASVDDEELLAHRHAVFDVYSHLCIRWQQHPRFHVMPFASYAPGLLTGESIEVRWWTIDRVREALATGNAPIHRSVRDVLARQDLLDAIEVARGDAVKA